MSYNGSTHGWGSCNLGSIPSIPTDSNPLNPLFYTAIYKFKLQKIHNLSTYANTPPNPSFFSF